MRQNTRHLILQLPQSISLKTRNSNLEAITVYTDTLDIDITDDNVNKIIKVWIKPAIIPIFLYSKNNYQPLINFTNEQLQIEILSRINDDLEFKLNSLLAIR